MIPIPAVVAAVLQRPAPVFVVDTCSLIDLFRRNGHEPRASPGEIAAAADLLRFVTNSAPSCHLVVPELVPREFADNADQAEREFKAWFKTHDQHQTWPAETAPSVGVTLAVPAPVRPLGIRAGLRRLADDLLAAATVLARDRPCVDRAVDRVVTKRRPSHKKELKDSMNLEQTLELAQQLQRAGLTNPRVFVSSNTNDFAVGANPAGPNPAGQNATDLHPELRSDFTAAGLTYAASLLTAVRPLQAMAQLPP